MDSRLRATLIAVLAGGLLVGGVAVAAPQPGTNEAGDTASGTNIFGNSALPKGLVIVPWQKAAPDKKLDAQPTRLVDAPLEPIDPDVFRRKLQFYEQQQTHASGGQKEN